jgi:magnesium transporter
MYGLGKRISRMAPLPPGSLVHVGEKRIETAKISVIDYDEEQFKEKVVERCEECFPYRDKPTVTWINIDGIHDAGVIEGIGTHFGLHPLLLEDIMNTEQRPKAEDFGERLFIVLKMLYYDERGTRINVEQVSLVLGPNFVISFQEREGDVFESIRQRLREKKGRVRAMGADYLAYSLIDAIVDSYFFILEKVGENIETMEEGLVSNPRRETLQAIHDLKTEMIFLRKSVWPLRELLSVLERQESSLVQESTVIYLRDLYDHTIQVMDSIETYRDIISGMRDTYLSSISNRMNEVMKVLTVFASIFIPLTFLAGVYGMNFEHMPELGWRWSYPVLLVIFVGTGFSMLAYFKKKKWL